MSKINGATQTEQQFYTPASEVKQYSASDVSVFNKGIAVTNQVQEKSAPNNSEVSEKDYNEFVEGLASDLESDGATKKELVYIFDNIGYTKDKILSLTRDEFFETSAFLGGIAVEIFGNSGNKDQKIKNIIVLSKYNNIKELNEYLQDNGSKNFIDLIHKLAKSEKLEIPDEIRTKMQNIKSVNDLSNNELKGIIMILVRNCADLNISTEQLMSNIFLNLPDDVLKMNSDLCLALYDVVKDINKEKMPKGLYPLMIQRLSYSDEELQAVISNDIIDDMFKSLDNAKDVKEFLINIQEIIDNGAIKDKTVFANRIAEFLQEKLAKFNEINAKAEKTQEDIAFLKNYEDIEKFAAAHGFANVCANDESVKKLNKVETTEEYKKLTYKYTYETSLSDKLNVDPIKITQRMNEITNNAYSEALLKMGYELPTEENLDTLREKAANGELKPSAEIAHREAESEGIGYAQAPRVLADNSSSNAAAIQSYIYENSSKETFRIDGKVDEKIEIKPIKPVNISNLGNYSGEELQYFIQKKLVKFSDAVKQYTSKLSESGKQFVVNEIKRKNKGEQTYALNSACNTAKFDIMKKADLFDEGLNVNFDTIHQKLAEGYTA